MQKTRMAASGPRRNRYGDLATVLLTVLILSALAAGNAQARIKLVALPERDVTLVRLDNPQATLISEERVLTLEQGVNRVDFSWQGVTIDPDSIRLEPLSHPDRVTLLNVSYPPGEGALVWEIASAEAFEERVRISYLLSNLDRLVAYRWTADKEETSVDFTGFLILRNFSGEDFDDARFVLDQGEAHQGPLRNQETRQVLFLTPGRVPMEKFWTFDAGSTPWDPEQVADNVGIPVGYRLENKEAAGLGRSALWGGKIRMYQNDGHGGIIFLGEDRSAPVPVGESMEATLGQSRDIVVTQRKMKELKVNIRRNRANRVVLYDSDETIEAVMENFKDTPAVLTVIERIPGEWRMTECNHPYERRDAGTLEFRLTIPGHSKESLVMQYQRRNIRP